MPGLVFIIKHESHKSHLYPVNVCHSCASAAHDFSRCIIPREAYANSTAQCPICGKYSNLIIYLRTIYNPDLLVDINELRNLFAKADMDFTLVNILQTLDEKKISILPRSGMQAISYLRKWRDENPNDDLPTEHLYQLALLSEDPGFRHGSALDHRVGDLKNHMMKCARTRVRNTIMSSRGSRAFDEVNRLLALTTLTSIRAGDRDGAITDSIFANL